MAREATDKDVSEAKAADGSDRNNGQGAHGTTPAETQKPTRNGRRHIFSYTGPEFSKWNAALRSGNVDKVIREKIDALVSVLKGLPDYKGTVYRGTILPPDVLARYQEGRIITEPAFLSTSTKNGGFTGAVRFRIESKSGNLISADSRYPGESEVLFPPGTQFEVTKRKYNRLTATTWIHMAER